MNTKKCNNGKIYKISSIHTVDIYIGSTNKEFLYDRLSGHTYAYKKYLLNEFPYMTSFDIIKMGDYSISLIENFKAENREELYNREAYYIQTLPNVINKYIPGRTYKEWKEENKEKLKLYAKEYREKNKEKIAETQKIYYANNQDKIKEYRENNKDKIAERKKNYYEKNKEQIKEGHDAWKANNKEHIAKYKRDRAEIKIVCCCSSIISIDEKTRHEKTKKHTKYINSLPKP